LKILNNYEVNNNNNNKRINKKNTEWLRKITKRTFEKSLWNYSMKILTYLPIFNKNQRNLQQILVDAYETSKKCSRCGNYIEFISNNRSLLFYRYSLNLLEHGVLEGQAWAKLPTHRKSSIRGIKGEKAKSLQ